MKQGMHVIGAAVCVLMAVAAFAGTPGDATIEGKYLEVRSCDVFTGACTASSEVGLTGREAVLAWDITKGSHEGVNLGGLKVVAIVRASATLGGTSESVYPAKSVVVVDEKANAAQREALLAFAKEMAGRLLDDVIHVEAAPIAMAIHQPEQGRAKLTAGDKVAIETCSLSESDRHCGNEVIFYGPLTRVHDATAAHTELDRFSGAGLGVTWSNSGRRSAWLATFSN